MRFNDYFSLAFKNIFHQRSRSVLAILAIVIGTTSVTILLALVIGAKDFYYDQFKATGKLQQLIVNPQKGLDFQESQRASSCDNCVELTDKLADKITSIKHVEGLSKTADINTFRVISLNGKKTQVKSVQAYQPDGVIKHLFLAGHNFSNSDGSDKIIIGQNYADELGYKDNYKALIGKKVTLTTSSTYTGEGAKLPDPLTQFKDCQDGCDTEALAAQQKPTTIKATVVGVESDEVNNIFVPLKWATGLLENQRYEITKADQAAYSSAYTAWVAGGRKGAEPTPKFTLNKDSALSEDGYASFVVKVDNPDNTTMVAKEIQELGVGTAVAKTYVNDQLQVFNIISYILAGIGSVALTVAAIGIINTMVMATLERTKEIGVMRAVGARRSIVSRLFTLEASLLGFLGGVFGVTIGYGLTILANIFINNQLAANAVSSRDIISLPAWLALAVILSTTVLGMLAGLYPAHRAARLDPVDALRHE